MLPAHHPDLQAAAVVRQHVIEDWPGCPTFIRGVKGYHGEFWYRNLRQKYPREPVSVDDLMHCNFDLQVGGAWCQSCPWATTHQLDRRDEAEKEMKKGNMRRVSACVHLRANKYQLWPSVPSHCCQLHKQLSSFHWGLSATPITTVSHLMIQQAVLLYCWN